MSTWTAEHAAQIAAVAERELEALVAVSSPSGDNHAADEAAAVAAAMAPAEAQISRIRCSSDDHADDLLISLTGTGGKRLVLVGHLDTVIAHAHHELLKREGDKLVGSGSIDMKGGDALALGVLRALTTRTEDFAQVDLLLVVDEEWRVSPFAHTARFAGYDACLTFEGGERDADGNEAVVVRRKAAGSISVKAKGLSAHAGSKPDDGRNALVALAQVAQRLAACHDPDGPDRRSAVPTVMHAGGALNVVPDRGELLCDVRADHLDAVEAVLAEIPPELDGVTLSAENLRRWPGMDSRAAAQPVLDAAGAILGRPIVPAQRGGASDASHFAQVIPVTIDGLGPLGAHAHAPGEYVDAKSLQPRAETALSIVEAVLSA